MTYDPNGPIEQLPDCDYPIELQEILERSHGDDKVFSGDLRYTQQDVIDAHDLGRRTWEAKYKEVLKWANIGGAPMPFKCTYDPKDEHDIYGSCVRREDGIYICLQHQLIEALFERAEFQQAALDNETAAKEAQQQAIQAKAEGRREGLEEAARLLETRGSRHHLEIDGNEEVITLFCRACDRQMNIQPEITEKEGILVGLREIASWPGHHHA